MKLTTVIYNAIRSIILGSLFQLLYYYTYMKGKGVECSLEEHAYRALVWTAVFFAIGILSEWFYNRKEKKNNEENNQ
jgi:hypothetical protein